MTRPTIFISYSHQDEEWKDKLVTQLGVLQQQDYLDIWVDTRIEGGADWFGEIKEAIEATSIAVLLISADFLEFHFRGGVHFLYYFLSPPSQFSA